MIENILQNLPKFKADNLFRDQLKERLIKESLSQTKPAFSLSLRLVYLFASVLILIGGTYVYSQQKTSFFAPKKVLAAEIIKRNLNNFFQKGTIYHEVSKLYLQGQSQPITYELWQDLDQPQFLNRVIYPDPIKPGGQELWQGKSLYNQWEADLKEKTFRKEIYIYNYPGEEFEIKGERVDLAKRFDELLTSGILEAKEGKLDNRDVYIVYDTRNAQDKYWDSLTFDKQTFQLLKTEKYSGEGSQRQIETILVYELQESLSRNEDSLQRYFNQIPISIEGFKIYERHFNTSKGYIDDYTEIPNDGKLITLIPTINPEWKTYQNSQLNFNLNYPQDGKLIEEKTGDINENRFYTPLAKIEMDRRTISMRAISNIDLYAQASPLEVAKREIMDNSSPYTIEETSIGGLAMAITQVESSHQKIIYTMKHPKQQDVFLEISFDQDFPKQEEIISSLKFLQ